MSVSNNQVLNVQHPLSISACMQITHHANLMDLELHQASCSRKAMHHPSLVLQRVHLFHIQIVHSTKGLHYNFPSQLGILFHPLHQHLTCSMPRELSKGFHENTLRINLAEETSLTSTLKPSQCVDLHF